MLEVSSESPSADANSPAPGAPEISARPSEVELVGRLLGGDEQAFADLVAEHHGPMLRIAHSFVSTGAAAEDVVQETWLAILEGLAGFEGRSSLKTWMYRILTNRAKTRGKREGRSVPMSAVGPPDDDGRPVVDPDRFAQPGHWSVPPQRWPDPPDRIAEDAETRALLEAAIAELPPRQRAVITLRDLQGWTTAEVCNVLEVSETNQRVLLHRARSKVRAALETYYQGKR